MAGLPCVCPEPVRGSLPDAFLEHVKRGDLTTIEAWLTNDGGDVNAATEGGQTLLSMACVYNRLDVLEKLLEQPSIHLNTRHRLGTLNRFTPLCIAAYKDLPLFVSALLSSSGQCRLDVGAKTGKGINSLRLAAEKDHWEVVKILQPDLPIPQKDASVITSLAKLAKQTDMLKLLIEQLKQDDNQQDTESIPASEKVYDNSTKPRGLVVILNYKFESDPNDVRKGTDADAVKLKNVFERMDYETEEHRDLTRQETYARIEDFCSQDRLKDISCVVVVVLSHGINRETFMTADKELITMNKLCRYFTDEKCPHMKGKPKIFLLQFCRGEDSARQVTSIRMKPLSDQGLQTDAVQDAFTDMMCIYSSQEGLVSYRFEGKPLDPFAGTPFVHAFCRVLTNKGNLWLDDLIREFMEEYGNTLGGQPMDYHNLTFRKKFCFNPIRQ